jgi:alkaline phosphatase
MKKTGLAILLSLVVFSACTSGNPRVRHNDPAVEAALESRNRWFAEGQKAVRDVAIYAVGPSAQMVRGVLEQNVIFHIILAALRR